MNRFQISSTRSAAEIPAGAAARDVAGLRSEFTDVTVAAAVADLKSRWPRIGEVADHPLLEWFINWRTPRRQARNRTRQAVYVVAACALTIGFAYTAQPLLGYFGPLVMMMAGLILGTHIRRHLANTGGGAPREPLDLLNPMKGNNAAHILAMPLSPRNIAGIAFAADYWKTGYRPSHAGARWSIPAAGILCALGMAVFLIFHVRPLFVAVDFCSVIFISFSLHALNRSRSSIAMEAIGQIDNAINARTSNYIGSALTLEMRIAPALVAILLTADVAYLAYLIYTNANMAALFGGISLIAWSGIILGWRWWLQYTDIEQYFDRTCEKIDEAYGKLSEDAAHAATRTD